VRTAAKELGAVDGSLLSILLGLLGRGHQVDVTYCLILFCLQSLKLLPKLHELAPEVFDPLKGLFLLGGDELPLSHAIVVINRSGQRCQ
jgi:hypothetical protein